MVDNAGIIQFNIFQAHLYRVCLLVFNFHNIWIGFKKDVYNEQGIRIFRKNRQNSENIKEKEIKELNQPQDWLIRILLKRR